MHDMYEYTCSYIYIDSKPAYVPIQYPDISQSYQVFKNYQKN